MLVNFFSQGKISTLRVTTPPLCCLINRARRKLARWLGGANCRYTASFRSSLRRVSEQVRQRSMFLRSIPSTLVDGAITIDLGDELRGERVDDRRSHAVEPTR